MPARYRLEPCVGMTPGAVDRRPPCAIRPRPRHHDGVSERSSTADVEPAPTAAVDAPATASGTHRRRFKIDKTLLYVSLVVGLGLALVTRGLLLGVTGDERSHLPEAIERVDPVPDAEQALSQTSIVVDLATGYIGTLVIDGVAVETIDVSEVADDRVQPGQQVSLPPGAVYEPGNATLTFTPSAGAPIEEFLDGEHQVTVRYWPLDENEQRARTYTWSFNVV